VAAFTVFEDLDHAIELVNDSDYGLGVSVFTSQPDRIVERSLEFSDGALFINDMVKSDPRLPFGGTGISGFGRELGSHGIKEFVNIKTVYVV
jgi:succinate-semialdehyde dehydrogenase/glutarate-semialdehyde dehydrogenase